MRDKYDILDAKLWAANSRSWSDTRPKFQFRSQRSTTELRQTFRIIIFMLLAFLFWGLSEVPGAHYTKILNTVGWFFALGSLWYVFRSHMEGRRV